MNYLKKSLSLLIASLLCVFGFILLMNLLFYIIVEMNKETYHVIFATIGVYFLIGIITYKFAELSFNSFIKYHEL